MFILRIHPARCVFNIDPCRGVLGSRFLNGRLFNGGAQAGGVSQLVVGRLAAGRGVIGQGVFGGGAAHAGVLAVKGAAGAGADSLLAYKAAEGADRDGRAGVAVVGLACGSSAAHGEVGLLDGAGGVVDVADVVVARHICVVAVFDGQVRGAHGFIAGAGVLVGEGQGGVRLDALACVLTGQLAHGGAACGVGGAVIGLADLGGGDGEVGLADGGCAPLNIFDQVALLVRIKSAGRCAAAARIFAVECVDCFAKHLAE